MNNLTFLLLLLLYLDDIYCHDCIHDQMQSKMNIVEVKQDYKEIPKGRQLDEQFLPIRFHLDYSFLDSDPQLMCTKSGETVYLSGEPKTYTCKSSDILTSAKRKYIVEQLIPIAQSYFQKALQVVHVDGNLKLYRSSDFDVKLRNYACYKIPKTYTGEGIGSADYVIFVTARPTEGSTLAWALACNTDQYGRPIAGQVNLGPARLSEDDPKSFNEQLGVTIHEITHALGFSGSNFRNFKEYFGGPPREYNSVVSKETTWKTMTKIISPKVVQVAKEHFGCDDWPNAGVELEDYGGSGTAGSHWEKRILHNEYMTGIASRNPVYSKFTLALFEDMGYYKVNWTVAEPLKFGKGKGCTFVLKQCSMWSSYSDYWCTSQTCSYDMKDKSTCLIKSYTEELNPSFQYYPGEPKKGGWEEAADYCPIPYPAGDGNCQNSGTKSVIVIDEIGESVGFTSRCYMSEGRWGKIPSCYKSRCNNKNKLELFIKNEWHEMSNDDGGTYVFEGDFGAVTITYPSVEEVCPYVKICRGSDYDKNIVCSGHGHCLNSGVCICEQGYSGEGCETLQCPKGSNGIECSGSGICNSEGKCACNDGFSGNACELKGCPNECTSTTHGICDTSTGKCKCIEHFYGDDCAESFCPPYYNATNSCYSNKEQGVCDKKIGVCACNFKYENVKDYNDEYVKKFNGYYTSNDCSMYKQTEISQYEKITLNDFQHASDPVRITKTIKYHQYQYFETEITSASYSIYIVIDNIKPNYYLAASTESPLQLYASFIHDPPSGVYNQYIANYNASSLIIEMVPGVDNSPFTTIGTVRFSVIELIKKEKDDDEDCSYDIYVIQDPCQDENYKKCNGNGVCKNGKCECNNKAFTGSQCNILNCNPACLHGTCVIDSKTDKNSSQITVDDLKCNCDGGYKGDSCNEEDEVFMTPPIKLEYSSSSYVIPSELVDVGYYSLFQFEVGEINKIIIFNIEFPDILTMAPIILFKYKKYPKVDDYDIFSSNDWSVPHKNVKVLLDANKGLITGTWYLSIYNSLYSTTKLNFTVNMFSPQTDDEYNTICGSHYNAVNKDNANMPTCICSSDYFYIYTGDFCEESINVITRNEHVKEFDLGIGEYYYMRLDLKDNPNKYNYYTINITNSKEDSDVLLLVSTEQLPRLDKSAYYDEYSVSLSSSSQEVVINTESADYLYITVTNRITSRKNASIFCNINGDKTLTYSEYNNKLKSVTQQLEIKQQLIEKLNNYIATTNNDNYNNNRRRRIKRKYTKTMKLNNNFNTIKSSIELCNTSDTTSPCIKYHKECYYRGIYQDNQCNCLTNWNGIHCNTPVLRSIQMLMFSAQNIKMLCNKCQFKLYLKRGSFNLYIIPLPLRETELNINVFGVDKDGKYTESLNNDADILISNINPRTLYDFHQIIAYNGNNETYKINTQDSNNKENNKIYLAVYANTNGYYNISVSVNEDTAVDTGEEIFNELVDWAGNSTTGIVSLVFVILFLLLPICCLCNPICSKDEIIRLDMGKIVHDYITNNTSNNTNNTLAKQNKKLENQHRREELRRKKKGKKGKKDETVEIKTVLIEMTPFTFNDGESPVPYLYILNGEYRVVNPPKIELLKNPIVLKQADNAII